MTTMARSYLASLASAALGLLLFAGSPARAAEPFDTETADSALAPQTRAFSLNKASLATESKAVSGPRRCAAGSTWATCPRSTWRPRPRDAVAEDPASKARGQAKLLRFGIGRDSRCGRSTAPGTPSRRRPPLVGRRGGRGAIGLRLDFGNVALPAGAELAVSLRR